MLVSRQRGRLQLVRHPDHGRLAGALAQHWGSDRFQPPSAGDALVIAATHHDDGWAELDDQPVYAESAARPAHFLEIDLGETVAPYRRGVDSVYARNSHAGALVSMHWAGLYSTRWGLQDGSPVGHPRAAEVVAEQEQRWVSALRESWGYQGPRSRFEADTWHAYEILQSLDFLALALSLLDLDNAVDGDPISMPMTLALVEQPPGPRLVPGVPTTAGAERTELLLWVAEPGRVLLAPYPLDTPEVSVELPVRELEDRRYTAAEAVAAYHDAPVSTLRVTLAAG